MTTITVLGTGGTISCTHAPNGDLVPTLTTADVLRHADITSRISATDIQTTTRDVIHLDSSNITLADIDALVQAVASAIDDGADGIVLLHGTDTLEETAMVLHYFFAGTVPIVLTGAQRPSDAPNPDGPANIRQAIEHVHAQATTTDATARPNASARPGVWIVFGGRVISAYGATKRHTTDDDAFANTLVDGSATTGADEPIGAGVNLSTSAGADAPNTADTQDHHTPVTNARPSIAPLAGLNVPIVTMYAGASAEVIPSHADGLVIAALGSGNVPQAIASAITAASYPVVICTRVREGSVHLVYGGAGGGASLKRAGIRSGGALPASQARMLLLCELATGNAHGRATSPG